MYKVILILLYCSVLATVQAATSGWQSTNHLKAELVSEYQQVTPGQSVTLALHFIPDPHWHTYWQNPGDSGLPTRLSWQLPAGVSAGDIQWPAPAAIAIPPLMNYGFSGDTVLLSELQLAPDYNADVLALAVTADWLVCEEVCIPAQATFQLTLPVGDNAVIAADYQGLFARARQQLPLMLLADGQFDTRGGAFSAVVNLSQPLQITGFFVSATELVDHAAEQRISLQGQQLLLQQPLNTYFDTAPEQLELVLTSADAAYKVVLQQAPNQATDIVITRGQQNKPALWLILLMAAAGGFLLNLMPCVFPVLSLKALSITTNSGDRRRQQHEALFYSLGVLLSFITLALLLITLRAGGAAVGWGFQLQSPYMVALLLYLLFALGLSLSGVVQFGLGLMQTGNSLAAQSGAKGAFFTGVLAVVVASPCTAPFMGAALGYAVGQNSLVAVLVFIALGLGMALPFLLLAFLPALAQRLPKPGAWMDSLKHWLAYPLYLSAVWLLWVYGRQAGIDAQALVLLGLVCIAAVCWLWGRRQQQQAGRASMAVALLLLLLALILPLLSVTPPQTAAQTGAEQHWQPWSATRLQQLRQQGKPVLVNMTADWCITCLVNEKVALNTDSSKAALALFDVTYLKGDWTKRDAEISAYLRLYQRDGVPLYVLYWPGQPPEVLPQILTPDTLAQTLERLSRQP